MNVTKKIAEEIKEPLVQRPTLSLVPNTGANRDLPTACRYCELREEMRWTQLSF